MSSPVAKLSKSWHSFLVCMVRNRFSIDEFGAYISPQTLPTIGCVHSQVLVVCPCLIDNCPRPLPINAIRVTVFFPVCILSIKCKYRNVNHWHLNSEICSRVKTLTSRTDRQNWEYKIVFWTQCKKNYLEFIENLKWTCSSVGVAQVLQYSFNEYCKTWATPTESMSYTSR